MSSSINTANHIFHPLNGSLTGGRLKIASVRPSPSPHSSSHSSSLLLREGGLCTQAKLKTDGKNFSLDTIVFRIKLTEFKTGPDSVVYSGA